MRIPEQDAGEEFTLNLTSMIDVVFLLLIFFMVATTFLDPEKEIDIDLPKAESGQAPEAVPDELIINVLQDGSLTVSGQPVDLAGLRSTLERAARKDPKMPVTIRGDRQARHEAIVGVMDACGANGLTNLSIGTLAAQR